MDSGDDEDSINRICLSQETVFGKEMPLSNLGKMVGVIIRLRKNEDAAESKNILIAMLEELLKKDSSEVKKQKLEEQYGLVMNDETGRRLDVMCNLSEVVMEKGIEKGIQKGETRINNLYRQLVEQNRLGDLQRAIEDEEYRLALYAEFNL